MDHSSRVQSLASALHYLQTGRWSLAEAAARALAIASHEDAEAWLLAGLAIACAGDATRAAPVLQQVTRLRPEHAHPCQDLASLEPPPPAELVLRQYRACLRLALQDRRLRLAFAAFLLDNDGATEAIAVLSPVLDCADAHNLMGMALAESGDVAGAIKQFGRAVAQDPVPAVGWANLGMMLKIEDRFDEALAAYDEAVARSPRDARIRVNRAVALLRAGRWAEAWPEYEWRLRLPGAQGLPLGRLLPALDALGDPSGLTILATHEEGFGDTLMFMRYLPLLAERGARVIAWVPDALRRVVGSLPGIAVCGPGETVPAYDYQGVSDLLCKRAAGSLIVLSAR
jgi:Flp pilus assembly protein TadD